MEHILTIILGTVAIYLALFAHVAFSPKLSRRLIVFAAAFALVVGLVFFGMCFATLTDNPLLAILNTCYSVFCLFIGEDKVELIADSPMMQYDFVQIVFSALTFFGIFATAGAAISAVGAKFLQNIRLLVQRKKPLSVIRTLNSNTLDFARELVAQKGHIVVFVDEEPDEAHTTTATELGCVVRSDPDALDAKPAFLRSIGIRGNSRQICLYALSQDRFANREYAFLFLEGLQQLQISRQQTCLTIFAEEDETENAFSNEKGGYGTVLCVNEEYMAARMLMLKAPPYQVMHFDENGRATEDFHALLIGSGNMGQAMIKQLVMNGQFAGSHFSLAIFDPEFEAITGRMHYECNPLFTEYDITPYCSDARSGQMYAYLSENWQKLKYVVVCAGNDDANKELCRQLSHFLAMHKKRLPLYICSSRGLQRIDENGSLRWEIFSPEVLCTDDMDRMAMLLNHTYCGNDKTPKENWADCDYFSRMSSRASADYAPAFLKMAGLSADAIPEGKWYTDAQLENMAISEHERWCAFHYCMGFRPMTRAEFDERCRIYTQEKAKNPGTRYRIGKDLTLRIHCCLIPWEELTDLSARENAVTGKNVDYKEMDRNNVRMLPELLKADKA